MGNLWICMLLLLLRPANSLLAETASEEQTSTVGLWPVEKTEEVIYESTTTPTLVEEEVTTSTEQNVKEESLPPEVVLEEDANTSLEDSHYPVSIFPFGGHREKDRTVQFVLYTEKTKRFREGVPISMGNRSLIHHSGFNVKAPTKVICHGYMSNHKRGPGKLLVPAYFRAWKGRGSLNIISVNWSSLAGLLRTFVPQLFDLLYFPPARNTERVGKETASLIAFLVEELGADLSSFHLIGHSLGAHVMGYAGRELKKKFGKRVARITALDPAGPCFETFRRACFRGRFQAVSRADADFVDVIHTHTWALGMKKPIGHVDFYPNGGMAQPGCFKLSWGICSHKRAIELMEESILNGGYEIRAYRCQDFKSLKRDTCSSELRDDFALLGEPCTPTSQGIYYLRTNSKKPYITQVENGTHFAIRL